MPSKEWGRREDKENEDPGAAKRPGTPLPRRVAVTPKGKRGRPPAPLRTAGAARTPLADTTELVNAQSNRRGAHGEIHLLRCVVAVE